MEQESRSGTTEKSIAPSPSKVALLLSTRKMKHSLDSGDNKFVDNFAITDSNLNSEEVDSSEPSWDDFTTKEKVAHVCKVSLKVLLAFTLLYFFICSLDLLAIGFRIVSGTYPRKLFRLEVLDNQVVGLMCGILFTILVQSSSTTTSTVVGLVAGKSNPSCPIPNFIPIRSAIPIVMGANIGTSVTNTLMAMMQVTDRDKFRLAFAAATVHDMFNWLTCIVLHPLESITGYLYYTTSFLVQEISDAERSNNTKKIKLLKALTEPLTKTVVQIDKKSSMVAVNVQGHIFTGSTWGNGAIGGFILALSIIMLLLCLFILIKILKSVLKGKIAYWIRRTSTSNLPHCPRMTDYVSMLMGAFFTFLFQSSSAFTSTLPPLVAVRALSIERAYTLTLGANVGTTTTALMAAMTQTKNFSESLQIALCHLFFNLTGILLFFPIPCTRFPVKMAKALANTTAHYRWFAIVYVLGLFILLPLLFMGLAFAGPIFVICVAILLILGFLFVFCINSLKKYTRFMPKIFHNWNWLPEWLRSLEPYDRMLKKCTMCHHVTRSQLCNNTCPEEKPEHVMEEERESKQHKSESHISSQKTEM